MMVRASYHSLHMYINTTYLDGNLHFILYDSISVNESFQDVESLTSTSSGVSSILLLCSSCVALGFRNLIYIL